METIKFEVLATMAQIASAADRCGAVYEEFDKYDFPALISGEHSFPMIWVASSWCTVNVWLADLEKEFFSCAATRELYQREGWLAWAWPFGLDGAQSYLVTADKIRPLTEAQADEALRDYLLAAVAKWERENGPLPELADVCNA